MCHRLTRCHRSIHALLPLSQPVPSLRARVHAPALFPRHPRPFARIGGYDKCARHSVPPASRHATHYRSSKSPRRSADIARGVTLHTCSNRFAEAQRCRADSHLSRVPRGSTLAAITAERSDRTVVSRDSSTATIERDIVDNRGKIDGRACPPRASERASARAPTLSLPLSLALALPLLRSVRRSLTILNPREITRPGVDRRPRATLDRRLSPIYIAYAGRKKLERSFSAVKRCRGRDTNWVVARG